MLTLGLDGAVGPCGGDRLGVHARLCRSKIGCLRAVRVVRASVRAKCFSTDNFLWTGRVVCVSQFRLDRDKFDQRLGRLEKDGEAFDKAQNEFALGAQAATGAMASAPAPGEQNSAGIGELDQFYAPLHTTLFASERELQAVSRGQKHCIGQLREAVASFEGVNEAERAKYLERLAALDGKFTYRRPQEMQEFVEAYAQARNLVDVFSQWGGK